MPLFLFEDNQIYVWQFKELKWSGSWALKVECLMLDQWLSFILCIVKIIIFMITFKQKDLQVCVSNILPKILHGLHYVTKECCAVCFKIVSSTMLHHFICSSNTINHHYKFTQNYLFILISRVYHLISYKYPGWQIILISHFFFCINCYYRKSWHGKNCNFMCEIINNINSEILHQNNIK